MILADLRQGTASLHRSIEEAMPLFPQISSEDYRRLLEKFWGFYAGLEKKYQNVRFANTDNLNLLARRRTPFLRKDLFYFQKEASLENLPLCQDLPEYGTWPEFFGGLYVIEGSSLGGQVITAHLNRLGFPRETCHFFAGYGAETGPMWQVFLQELQLHVISEEERFLAVRAAQQTFIKLERWLRQI